MADASRDAIIRQVPATDGGLHVTDCSAMNRGSSSGTGSSACAPSATLTSGGCSRQSAPMPARPSGAPAAHHAGTMSPSGPGQRWNRAARGTVHRHPRR